MRAIIKSAYWIAFRLLKIRSIVASERLAATLAGHGMSRFAVAHTGTDIDLYKRTQPNKFSGEKKSRFVILLSVYDDYRKDMPTAVKALTRLSQIRAAKDWEVWAIRQNLANIPGVKVKNLGFLSGEDLRDALSCADIYLLPSRSEGLSLLMLNALACGCVVVGTEAANIITDGRDGLISPVADADGLARNLERAMNDLGLFAKLRDNGCALADEHSLAKSYGRFMGALSKI
jgi:glycosyltransferase involved in cell wall biosynthesis